MVPGCGRPIYLGYLKTVGQRGRHTIPSIATRTVVRADRARGENKRRLLALGQRFERAADGFGQARSALAENRTQDYLAALDLLAQCCPP